MMQMHFLHRRRKEEADRHTEGDKEEPRITSGTRQNQLLLANFWKEAGLRVSSDHSHWSEMLDMQKEEEAVREAALK